MKKVKEIDVINKDYEWVTKSIFDEMNTTFFFLRANVACNLFIINHPELKIEFPFRGKVGVLDGYLHKSDSILDKIQECDRGLIKINDNKLFALWQEAKDMLSNASDFDRINIRDKESFKVIFEYCRKMELICNHAWKEGDPSQMLFYINPCFFLSIDLVQKYFELIGYWTAKMEDKARKRDSGKGQKEAKQKRVNRVSETIIKKFVDDLDKDVLFLDKGYFNKILCEAFVGAEDYPRHPQTIITYKKEVERALGKKIKLQKGSFLKQNGSVM